MCVYGTARLHVPLTTAAAAPASRGGRALGGARHPVGPQHPEATRPRSPLPPSQTRQERKLAMPSVSISSPLDKHDLQKIDICEGVGVIFVPCRGRGGTAQPVG